MASAVGDDATPAARAAAMRVFMTPEPLIVLQVGSGKEVEVCRARQHSN